MYTFYHDGVYYSSPNATYLPEVPPFQNSVPAKLEQLQHPLWLSNKHPYLALLPVSVRFSGPILFRFGFTRSSVPVEVNPQHGQWALKPNLMTRWMNMEGALHWMIPTLHRHSRFGMQTQIAPIATPMFSGYMLGYMDEASAHTGAIASQDAFIPKFCELSWALLMHPGDATSDMPKWMATLIHDYHVHPEWVHALCNSVFGDFTSPENRWHGAFVDPFTSKWNPEIHVLEAVNVPLCSDGRMAFIQQLAHLFINIALTAQPGPSQSQMPSTVIHPLSSEYHFHPSMFPTSLQINPHLLRYFLQPPCHFFQALHLIQFCHHQNNTVVSELVNPWQTSSAGKRNVTTNVWKLKHQVIERFDFSANRPMQRQVSQGSGLRCISGWTTTAFVSALGYPAMTLRISGTSIVPSTCVTTAGIISGMFAQNLATSWYTSSLMTQPRSGAQSPHLCLLKVCYFNHNADICPLITQLFYLKLTLWKLLPGSHKT